MKGERDVPVDWNPTMELRFVRRLDVENCIHENILQRKWMSELKPGEIQGRDVLVEVE